MSVNVWRRRSERVPYTQVPAIALLRLSPDAYWLYGFLLEYAETVPGAIVDLRLDGRLHHTGLSRNRLQRAVQELVAGGFYSYGHDRNDDGTFSRVQWVTQVPGALEPVEPTRRPVTRKSQALTRKKADSRAREQVRPAERHPADDVSPGRDLFPAQGRDQVRPAEIISGSAVSAGGDLFPPLGREQVRPAETPSGHAVSAGQDPFPALHRDQVRPAEIHPADDVSPGQRIAPSRAPLPSETDRQTSPLPPSADVPAQRMTDQGEEIASQPWRMHLDRAWRILETIDAVPMSRGPHRNVKVAERAAILGQAVAQRLAAGRPEQEIRDKIRTRIPREGIIDPYAYSLGRVEQIPLRAPGEGRTREGDRSFDETASRFDALGLPLYARPVDRPGAIDIQGAGGWREIVRRKEADDA